MSTHVSCNNQLLRRINQEHNDPRNLRRHYYFKADKVFVEFEHDCIMYKRFIRGQNKCARAWIEVVGQVPKGKSVQENAAMPILPLLDDYFANDILFKGSITEHVRRILPEIRRGQAVSKSALQDMIVQSNFSFSKYTRCDYEKKRN